MRHNELLLAIFFLLCSVLFFERMFSILFNVSLTSNFMFLLPLAYGIGASITLGLSHIYYMEFKENRK